MTCARVGLVNTGPSISLQWNATAASVVSSAFGLPFVGFSECCSPSLWCGSDNCTSFAPNENYFVNFGWTPNTGLAPVYTCVNRTDAGSNASVPATAPPVLGAVTPAVVNTSAPFLTLMGNGLGNTTVGSAVQVGNALCTSLQVCHTVCSSCATTSDCSSGQVCEVFSGVGRCVAQCSRSRACTCGTTCLTTPSYPFGVCVNADWGTAGVCSVSGGAPSYRPPPGSGFDSMLTCRVTSGLASTCGGSGTPGRGPLAVQMVVQGSVVVNGSGIAPAFTITNNVTECVADGDCGASTMCRSFRCQAGCCVRVPSGRCTTEPIGTAGTTQELTEADYILLPSQSAAAVSMPAVGPGDQRSPTSDVDDAPNQGIPLNFTFPFFDVPATTLYVHAQRNQAGGPCHSHGCWLASVSAGTKVVPYSRQCLMTPLHTR